MCSVFVLRMKEGVFPVCAEDEGRCVLCLNTQSLQGGVGGVLESLSSELRFGGSDLIGDDLL